MKEMRWILSMILLASLTLGLVACGGEPEPKAMPQAESATATPLPATDTPVPADTPEPTEPPKPVDTPKPTDTPESETEEEAAELNLDEIGTASDLSSYRANMAYSISGIDQGEAVEQNLTFLIEYTRDPAAQHIVVSSEGSEDPEGMGNIEMYQVGDMSYVLFGEEWLSVPATEELMDETGFVQPQSILEDTCGWRKESDTEYNGVSVHHWTASKEDMEECMGAEELATFGQLTAASGDLYIAVEGSYIVHMSLTFEGQNLEAAMGTDHEALDEGRMEFTYGLTDVNEPFAIHLPEEALLASSLPEDIPFPPDAQELANAFGMITFNSPSSAAEVADFYKAQMPQNGWTEVSVSEMSGLYMLEYSKDGRIATLMISSDEDTGLTSVLLTIQEEEG